MKKILLIFCVCIPLLSCNTTDSFETKVNSSKTKFTNSLVAYPKSCHDQTRGSNLQDNWENWNKVLLASGDSVYVPWNRLLAGTAIPYDIRTDIRSKDGWNLIAHTVNGYGERGMNYLVFHNKYTGILKVFYNLEPNQSNLQNTAIWKLHFEEPQSFLAFSENYARLSTDKSVSDIYLSNISNDESKGYTVGWNCFQVELAYDPDFIEGSLQIIPMSMTTSSIKFDGTFNSKTSGTVISTTTSNPLNGVVKGIANIAGKRAESWVSDEIKNKKFGDAFKNALSSGAGSLVKSGIGAALGSFVGAFSKTMQSTQSVQLKTEGTVELEGEIKTLQTGLIKPLSMSISVNDVGRLGVWCLTKEPSVLVDPYVHLIGQNQLIDYMYDYEMHVKTDWDNIYNVIINPDLVESINYPGNIDVRADTQVGSPERENAFLTKLHGLHYGMVSFSNRGEKLYDKTYSKGWSHYLVSLPFWNENGQLVDNWEFREPPLETYIPKTPDGYSGALPSFDTSSTFIALLNVQIMPNGRDDDVISLYHKFIPYLKWDYEQFDDSLYLELYPNVPIEKK